VLYDLLTKDRLITLQKLKSAWLMLDCARQVEFDDFDEIMSVCYTSEFGDNSLLNFDQQQSRNSNIAGLLD
jgi:hypothetical protein